MINIDKFIEQLKESVPELIIYKDEILETAKNYEPLGRKSTSKDIALFVESVFDNVDFAKINPDNVVLHVALLATQLSIFTLLNDCSE